LSEIALGINCKRFFEHDEDFPKSYLLNPLSLPYFTSDNLALLTWDVKDDV